MVRPAAALLACLLVLTGPAAAQTAAPAEELSPLGQAARQRGIVTCLASIDALAKELAKDRNIGAFIFNQLERPDGGLVSISLELSPSQSGGAVYMSANFVAVPGGACQVMVETSISWDSNCTAVGLAYPQYRVTGPLLGEVQVLTSGGSERLFLMPTARGGCVSIEKSVLF